MMRMMRMIGFYHPFPISPPKWQLCRARVRLYCFLSCYWQNQQHMTVLEDQLIFETKMIMMMRIMVLLEDQLFFEMETKMIMMIRVVMLMEDQGETTSGCLKISEGGIFFSKWYCCPGLIL